MEAFLRAPHPTSEPCSKPRGITVSHDYYNSERRSIKGIGARWLPLIEQNWALRIIKLLLISAGYDRNQAYRLKQSTNSILIWHVLLKSVRQEIDRVNGAADFEMD